jgi:hypothetical protein
VPATDHSRRAKPHSEDLRLGASAVDSRRPRYDYPGLRLQGPSGRRGGCRISDGGTTSKVPISCFSLIGSARAGSDRRYSSLATSTIGRSQWSSRTSNRRSYSRWKVSFVRKQWWGRELSSLRTLQTIRSASRRTERRPPARYVRSGHEQYGFQAQRVEGLARLRSSAERFSWVCGVVVAWSGFLGVRGAETEGTWTCVTES